MNCFSVLESHTQQKPKLEFTYHLCNDLSNLSWPKRKLFICISNVSQYRQSRMNEIPAKNSVSMTTDRKCTVFFSQAVFSITVSLVVWLPEELVSNWSRCFLSYLAPSNKKIHTLSDNTYSRIHPFTDCWMLD